MQNQRDGILDYHFLKIHGVAETAPEDANKYYQADADAAEGNTERYQNIAADPQVRQDGQSGDLAALVKNASY